jgi:uncharacterized protein (TIGR02147 family)
MRTIPDSNFPLKEEHFGALLGALYRARKCSNIRFSLQYLCNKAKIASKGYLSDVIAGRRKLNAKYAKGLADAFDLDGLERKIFIYMAQKECEPSFFKRELLSKKIQALRDQLLSGVRDVPENLQSPVLFTRVFCSLGVFSGPPTRAEVVKLLSGENSDSVNSVIDVLISTGAVVETNKRLTVSSAEIRFGNGNGTEANIRYVEEFLSYSKAQARNWYSRKSESFFESSTLSVRKDRYLEALPKIKELIDQTLSGLEVASDADELIHFGIQIFPDGLNRRASTKAEVRGLREDDKPIASGTP